MPRRNDPEQAFMRAEALQEALEECFGPGAQSKFARITGISRSQVSRYVSGICPVPKYVALLVEFCTAFKRWHMPVPEIRPVEPKRP